MEGRPKSAVSTSSKASSLSLSNMDAFLSKLGNYIVHKHNIVEYTLPQVEWSNQGVQIYQAQEIEYLKLMQNKKGTREGQYVAPTVYTCSFTQKLKAEDAKKKTKSARVRTKAPAKIAAKPSEPAKLQQIEEEECQQIWQGQEGKTAKADPLQQSSQKSEKSAETRLSITEQLRRGLQYIL